MIQIRIRWNPVSTRGWNISQSFRRCSMLALDEDSSPSGRGLKQIPQNVDRAKSVTTSVQIRKAWSKIFNVYARGSTEGIQEISIHVFDRNIDILSSLLKESRGTKRILEELRQSLNWNTLKKNWRRRMKINHDQDPKPNQEKAMIYATNTRDKNSPNSPKFIQEIEQSPWYVHWKHFLNAQNSKTHEECTHFHLKT